MKQKTNFQKSLKQRKFLLVLPLLTLPFITIVFAALGGGKGNAVQAQPAGNNQGLNLKLPDAHFKKGREADKLALYEVANKDSLKIKEAIKNDPYYKKDSFEGQDKAGNKSHELEAIFEKSASKYNQGPASKLKTSPGENESMDQNEKKVMEKLAQLKTAINNDPKASQPGYLAYNPPAFNPEAKKLQQLMNAMKSNEPDPELTQINGMLDKIMVLQHPETKADSIKKLSAKNKREVFTVNTGGNEEVVSSLGSSSIDSLAGSTRRNVFYNPEEPLIQLPSNQNVIEAVIFETQTLVSGNPITLRLLNDVYINGIRIPKNELVYGTTSFSNDRLKVSISSIAYKDNILPVSLEAYDTHGMAGIYIQGSINRDVSKQSADEAIGAIGLTTLDPSIGAQAASAGIQAAKSLMSKKIKLVRVTVNAGYKVFLKDSNQKQ